MIVYNKSCTCTPGNHRSRDRAPQVLASFATCSVLLLAASCSSRQAWPGDDQADRAASPDAGADAGSAATGVSGLTIVSQDPSDNPVAGLDEFWGQRFDLGDKAFDSVFRPTQGLGPLYIRQSCRSCHAGDSRGPGATRKMVHISEDGFSPDPDQSMFAYGHTVRPQSIEPDTMTAVVPPSDMPGILVTVRLGPPVFGRGAMEAILDSEIERLEAEQRQRTDGISGRINRVGYHSEPNPDSSFQSHRPGDSGLVGRFGLKARIATVDEFVADAYQGDMGITSPMRPTEPTNPDGLDDDLLPGVDIELETVNRAADYVRLLRIPTRGDLTVEGKQLFDDAQCAVCHAAGLKTRADYPIEAWADTRVDIYSDLLLHAMGVSLADGIEEEAGQGDEWRTAPLMGLRHLRSYMHDGRAETIRDAILAHAAPGSEANGSVEAFENLDDEQQAALLDFVSAL